MTLVPSLLQAIIRLDGDAVVMHVGDRPYVVTPAGPVDLATRGLTPAAVNGIVSQLLPSDSLRTLDEQGAARHELPAMPEFPDESFTIVAAGGGDDLWAEIRRRRATPEPLATAADPAAAPTAPAAVLPFTASPIRQDGPPPVTEHGLPSVDALLRLAATRGATTLYLSSGSQPFVRVDGDVVVLEGAPVFGPNDVESALLAIMPECHAADPGSREWIAALPVGRVRCLTFLDRHGPGGVFRLLSPGGVIAEQFGLPGDVSALLLEPEGLVLIAGLRGSGRRLLVAALVDYISRTHRGHIISLETEVDVDHEPRGSLISQREVRGGSDDMCSVARAALREDPDVLVLGEIRTAVLMSVALEAAPDRLVIAGLSASDATGALNRIGDWYPPEGRRRVQLSLAQDLRGVVAQVLLKKRGGGRVAAREILVNTPSVARVLAEGRTSELRRAIADGRKAGMLSMNNALAGYVQAGTVDLNEAHRRSTDRPGLLALLKGQGVDTSAVERLA